MDLVLRWFIIASEFVYLESIFDTNYFKMIYFYNFFCIYSLRTVPKKRNLFFIGHKTDLYLFYIIITLPLIFEGVTIKTLKLDSKYFIQNCDYYKMYFLSWLLFTYSRVLKRFFLLLFCTKTPVKKEEFVYKKVTQLFYLGPGDLLIVVLLYFIISLV